MNINILNPKQMKKFYKLRLTTCEIRIIINRTTRSASGFQSGLHYSWRNKYLGWLIHRSKFDSQHTIIITSRELTELYSYWAESYYFQEGNQSITDRLEYLTPSIGEVVAKALRQEAFKVLDSEESIEGEYTFEQLSFEQLSAMAEVYDEFR
jgi:hypothetical protein